jgi:hypothetical protein
MTERFTVAIIGSGPAGLSAAAHAAKLGLSHILLEAQPHLSDTIYKYQKGKHVMAEPGFLDLRSPLNFDAGTRESILNRFDDEIVACGTLIQNGARVVAIEGEKGNLRTLGVKGENLPNVQYQLDDPRAYGGETIIVVGPATQRSRTRWRWPRTITGSSCSTAMPSSAAARRATSVPSRRRSARTCWPAATAPASTI